MVMIECISIYITHFLIFEMHCWMLGEEFTSNVPVIFNIRNLKYFWISQMLLPQKLFCKTEKKPFQKSMCSGDWWFLWNPRARSCVCFHIILSYCFDYSGFMWKAAFCSGRHVSNCLLERPYIKNMSKYVLSSALYRLQESLWFSEEGSLI
jgi:hypothetical protein